MTITNPYYEFTPSFVPNTKAKSDEVNTQYQAIQNAFDLLPGASEAVTTDTAVFAPESGSGNSYVVTMPDTRTSNQDGDGIRFFATHTNTDATTLNVDGLGAVALVNWDGTVLTGNEIVSGRIYEVRFDATGSQFVLAATTDAALQVTYAEEWAIRAEDDPIPISAGGDGVTDFSAFHWAQKSLASAGSSIVNTNIVTATPPTTEAVIGAYKIFDLDNTDLLAEFGFAGSNALRVKNLMHGGPIELQIEDSAGTLLTGATIRSPSAGLVQLLVPLQNNAANPSIAFGDGDSGFYQSVDNQINVAVAGFTRFDFTTAGIQGANITAFGLRNLPASNILPTVLPSRLDTDTGLGWTSIDKLILIAGGVELLRITEDAAGIGNDATLNAPLFILEQAAAKADSPGYGQFWVRDDGPNTPMFTDDIGVDFVLSSSGPIDSLFLTEQVSAQADQTDRGQYWVISGAPNFPYFTDDAGADFQLAYDSAVVHNTGAESIAGQKTLNSQWIVPYGQGFQFGTNIASSDGARLSVSENGQFEIRPFVNGSSLSSDELRYTFAVNEWEFEGGLVVGGGTSIIRSVANLDTETRQLQFQHLDATIRGLIGYEANGDFVIRNQVHGAPLILSGENAAGVERIFLTADADAITQLRGAGAVQIKVGTTGQEFVLNANLNGSTDLYWDNVLKLRTANHAASGAASGAQVVDATGLVFRYVGFNTLPRQTISGGNHTLDQEDQGFVLFYNEGTNRDLVLNDDSNIPVDAYFAYIVGPSASILTGNAGTGVTITYFNGSVWVVTAAAGSMTIGEGEGTIWKESDTNYYISGPNLTT